MIRDQDEIAIKLKGYLDAGAAQLKAGTLYKLSQARGKALARLGESARASEGRTASAHAYAGAGHGTGSGGGGVRKGAWLWLGVVLIAAGGFGYQQWLVYQQTREMEELDVQILASDLPIDAYLDRGFQTWLTRFQP
jgi:Protein of unknown function (DUF3619)